MISEQEAKQLILEKCNSPNADFKWLVTECTSTPKADFWIIRGNTEEWIVKKQYAAQLTGVNAYLVDKQTGEVHTVISAVSIEEYLQDYYDDQQLDGKVYCLGYLDKGDNKAIVKIRQLLGCDIKSAKALTVEKSDWIVGKKRSLNVIGNFFRSKEIPTQVHMIVANNSLPDLQSNHIFSSDFVDLLKVRLDIE